MRWRPGSETRSAGKPGIAGRTGPVLQKGSAMSLRDDIQIMVVDDMATSRGLIVQALEKIGCYNIAVESDGACAYQQAGRKRVHLVISDYNMPGMDGLSLLRSLRQNPPTAGIGFILVTGRPDPDMIARGQAMGMNNLLTKPFDTAGMRNCIEAVVGRL